MNTKALSFLSLARKARRIEAGEEPVGAICRAHKARLVLVASDAGEHTLRRAQSFVAGTEQPLLRLSCDRDALGSALGLTSCAIAAISDVRLALAFVQALDAEDRPEALVTELAQRSARFTQRQKEARAHEKNLRQGKKKKP